MPLQEVLSPPCRYGIDKHQYEDLIRGDGEPVYLPASSHYHQVVLGNK